MQNRRKQNRLSTDAIVTSVTRALLRDLNLDSEFLGNPRSWNLTFSPLNSYDFKRYHQAVNFLKKYTFQDEMRNSSMYEQKAIETFVECQDRLRNHSYHDLDALTASVVSYARGWLQEVLKEYDLDEHLEECYFPHKASVGNGLSSSTLCAKWTTGLTGSVYHCEWFSHVYKQWHGHSVNDKFVDPRHVDVLQATLVPKRWNQRRLICPNTSIGGLYSNGLGRVLEQRLRLKGYDIKNLQEIHKVLARKASKFDQLATIDQTSASDNITVELCRKLLPHRWFSVINNGRIGAIRFDAEPIPMETMSTMGIGYTFPLQTLVFLSLAYGSLYTYEDRGRKVKDRTISCFGDDLIVPKELKDVIVPTFHRLGLVINETKSFWDGPFRESCGGDYHHGLDVRPAFCPTGGKLTRNEYLSFLCKMFNSLHRRWHMHEIRLSLETILVEFRSLNWDPYVVPKTFGDDSGLQLSLYEIEQLGLKLPRRNKHGTYSFKRFQKTGNSIRIKHHEYYYWRTLQRCGGFYKPPPNDLSRSLDPSSSIDLLCSNYTPTIETVEEPTQPKNYRSKLTGKKLKLTYSTVAQPGDSGRTKPSTGITCVWDE